jgi:predicted glycosyl hydrolase (DUF1957 family)
MKYINFFFHIYQPPIQDTEVIQKVVEECYLPLTRQILAFQDLKFTLNINFSLIEHLDRVAPEVLTNIRKAYENGNLELTESGAYHPIFPLIPEEEVKKQLNLNNQGSKAVLIKDFAPQGVFPPEMAFEPRLATLFKELGYQWTITDDFSLESYGIKTPYNKIYTNDGVAVFLRSNLWSNKLAKHDQWIWKSPADFVNELAEGLYAWIGEEEGYSIIALDGETFGHHIKEFDETFLHALFQAFFDSEQLQLTHIKDIKEKFNSQLVPEFIPPSSWSMDETSLKNRDYFPLWNSPGNKIHELQWRFTYYVLGKVRNLNDEEINSELDKALFSCQYWWASFWKFSPDMIYKGAFEMMRILQHVAELLGDKYDRIESGEELFRELITEVEKRQLSN